MDRARSFNVEKKLHDLLLLLLLLLPLPLVTARLEANSLLLQQTKGSTFAA